MSLTIRGKDEYLEQIIEELEEEGITLGNDHSSNGDDFLDLGIFGDFGRYCHSISDDRVDLQAQLPSHRKHFIENAIERNKDNE